VAEWIDGWVAIVCKRGHIATRITEIYTIPEYGKYCQDCGAALYHRCPACARQLPLVNKGAAAPSFCIGCGLPFPWATREDIVYHVQNQLDLQGLEEGDRRLLEDQLKELLKRPEDKDAENRQVKALEKLRDAAPKAWKFAAPILDPLITAWMKSQLGIP
jgi:hypothetical protein